MRIKNWHKSQGANYIAGFAIVTCVYTLIYLNKTSFLGTVLLLAGSLPFVYLLLFNKSVLLQIALFLVPLSIRIDTPFFGAAFSAPSEILLAMIVFFTSFIFIFSERFDSKLLRHPLVLLITIDLSWMIFCSFTSEMPHVSFKRAIMRFLFTTGLFIILIHIFKNKKILTRPLLLYSIGLVPAIIFVWKAHAHFNFDSRTVFAISQPFYADHTIYGACIAFVIPFVVILLFNSKLFITKQHHKPLLVVLLLVLMLAEFLSFSRAALISLILVFLLYLTMRVVKLKLLHLVAFLSIIGAFAFTFSSEIVSWARSNDAVSNDGDIANHYKSVTNISKDASNLERINRWICAYEMFKERPITGYGPGTYQFVYAKFQTVENTTYISTKNGDRGNAHSEYMTTLSETGLIGLLITISILLYTIYFGLSLYYQQIDLQLKYLVLAALLGLITFFFHGLVNSFLDQDKMAALVYPALALLVAVDLYHTKPVSLQNTEV